MLKVVGYGILLAFTVSIWSPAQAQNEARLQLAVAGIKTDLEELDAPAPNPFAIISGIGRRLEQLGEQSFDAYLTVITRAFNAQRDVFEDPSVDIFSFLEDLPTDQGNLLYSNLFGAEAGVDTRLEAKAVRDQLGLILQGMGATNARIRLVLSRIREEQQDGINGTAPPPPVSRS